MHTAVSACLSCICCFGELVFRGVVAAEGSWSLVVCCVCARRSVAAGLTFVDLALVETKPVRPRVYTGRLLVLRPGC